MGSSLGNCTSGAQWNRVDRYRRDSASAGASLPDPGVPTGSRLQEIALRAQGRNEASLSSFFNLLDADTIKGIKYACTDMWQAYLKVLRERAPGTTNILDRFHIMKKFSEALDKVRADQTVRLQELLKYNLKTTKAYLMREDFNQFWTYSSPIGASKFLRDWCKRANRSEIDPMRKIAKMLQRHEPLLLNWFDARGLSSGIVEGFNNKAKLTMRKSYGFKEVETISTALYHQLGDLPEPKRTHKFC